MSTLRQAIQDYLTMRRDLGFKLREAGKGLLDFAAFMRRRHAPYITSGHLLH
jgi:integrase/recombinase XerD